MFLSILMIHWILSNITMSFHHCVIVRKEENMLAYSSYVDIFILERDTLLLASYSGFHRLRKFTYA